MTVPAHPDAALQKQIANQLASLYPTAPIEARIATELVKNGRFEDAITASELEIILRNVVFTLIAEQKVAGLEVGVVHNVQTTNVTIQNGEAKVICVVHIHKPIVAFIDFSYTLENDPDTEEGIRLKPGTMQVQEKTRRFDLKAKAALTAMNVRKIALQEMENMAGIIQRTLPPQLAAQGVSGHFSDVMLRLNDGSLTVCLEGTFAAVAKPT